MKRRNASPDDRGREEKCSIINTHDVGISPERRQMAGGSTYALFDQAALRYRGNETRICCEKAKNR